MKYKILFTITIVLTVCFNACQTKKNIVQPKPKINIDLLYQIWDVESITLDGGKTSTGLDMGNPQYEFTRDGNRIKSYTNPPHTEIVTFIVRNDSILYTTEKPLPPVAILELTADKMILKSEKAEWKLYIKK
jgi:hypothetical protein